VHFDPHTRAHAPHGNHARQDAKSGLVLWTAGTATMPDRDSGPAKSCKLPLGR